MHAGEIETSMLLHLYPAAVRDTYASADFDVKSSRRHLLTLGLANYTSSGVIGLPSLANAIKGKAVVDSLVACFSDYLTALNASRGSSADT
jgi:creatinine amidohydrolase